MPLVLYWENLRDDSSSLFSPPSHPEPGPSQERCPSPTQTMNGIYFFDNSSTPGPTRVDQQPLQLERSDMDPTTTTEGSIHRRLRRRIGYSASKQIIVRHMESTTPQQTHQLQGAFRDLESGHLASVSGPPTEDLRGQYHHKGLCEQVWRHQISRPGGLRQQDLDTLPDNRHHNLNSLRPLVLQSRRSSESTSGTTTGMELNTGLLQHDRQQVGSSPDGPVCQRQEQKDTPVYVMETPSISLRPRCTSPALEKLWSSLRQPLVESPTPSTGTTTPREVASDSHHSQSDRISLVPDATGDDNSTTDRPSSDSSAVILGKRTRSLVEEPSVALAGVERERRASLRARGVDEATITLMRDSEPQRRKQQRYQPTQLKYIRFCQERNLDYSRADPVVLLNFLAWGYTTLRWKCTTVPSYRAHVKYLYPDTSDFDDDLDFSTFFKTLQVMEKGFHEHYDYDATPVREELLEWGSKDQLSIEQLTCKVCWLLGMCNFLRPSDIARIDLKQSLLSEPNFLRLYIVRPKEASRGIYRDKHAIVQAHPSEPILCPVNTIKAYLDRHARPILKSPHPTLLDLTTNPLVRYTKDATFALSSQRISKHIKSLMVLMALAEGSIPKARVAGSTVAAIKGVPIDDVITQGNWASHSTYLRFYRISSRTWTNVTSVLLN